MSATDWTQVKAGEVYTREEAARLLRVSVTTLDRHTKAGRLKPLPRLTPRGAVKYLGAELLKTLGDQAGSLTRPSETIPERAARAAAAAKRISEMAGGRISRR